MTQETFKKRIAKLILATGRKGVGKSYETYYNELLPALRGDASIKQPPRKVLIHDPNDEYGEFGVKGIDLSQVAHFVRQPMFEIRRLRPWKISMPTNGVGPMIGVKMGLPEIGDQLMGALNVFAGGLMLIEDINKHTTKSMPQDLSGAICTNRHVACDIIMHYQSVGRPLPQIWENCTELRFHYQNDDVGRSYDKLEDKYEPIKIMQILVNEQYLQLNNKRYSIWMDDEMRIIGDFNKEKLRWAIEEYLVENPGELKRYTNRVDRTSGKKLFNFETALLTHSEFLTNRYYGNAA